MSPYRAPVCIAMLFATSAVAQVPAFNSAGVTMGHHHLMVASVDTHKKIWIDVLGGTLSGKAPLEFVKFPGAFLILSPASNGQAAAAERAGSEGSAMDHFAFAVKEYEATRDKLAAAGVKITADRQTGQREFVAVFPDGIKAEFYEDKALATPIAHHHIHIMTTDVDAERAWWEKTFGAETTVAGTRKTTVIPGSSLAFAKVDAARAKTQGRSLDHTGVGVKNVNEYCAKLAAAGTVCERPSGPNTAIAMVTSPAGVRVEINQGLENR